MQQQYHKYLALLVIMGSIFSSQNSYANEPKSVKQMSLDLQYAGTGTYIKPYTYLIGAKRLYKNPSDVSASVKDGDIILLDAGEYGDCLKLQVNKLTISAQDKAKVVINNKACNAETKTWQIIGNDITINNIEFVGHINEKGNATALTFEGQNLTLNNIQFKENNAGLVVEDFPDSTIVIKNSTFISNGMCKKNCTYALDVNEVKELQVTNSKFLGQMQSPSILSQAAQNNIKDSIFDDQEQGTSSYLIELAYPSQISIENNQFTKGPQASNPGDIIHLINDFKQPSLATIDMNIQDGAAYDSAANQVIIKNNKIKNLSSKPTNLVRNETNAQITQENNQIEESVKIN